jgi:hypothetical protein
MGNQIVNGIRIAEDWIMAFSVSLAFMFMISAWRKLKDIPLGRIPLIAAIGLIPLLAWKIMGAGRRVFVDKAADPGLYSFLNTWGEAFEAFSGLTLAVVLLLLYRRSQEMLR